MPAAASWAFVTSVSALGIGCLVLLGATTPTGHLDMLARRPEFWAVLALAALGELWPVLRPGSTGPAEIMTSTMFSFAALLVLGLPGAVVVQTLATVLAGLARRTSWWRLAFDVAVLTLALMVAWWALGRTGVADAPSTTVVPAVIDMLHVATAGLAYFTVTHAMHWTAGVLARQQHLPGWFMHDAFYRSVVHATLIGLAPLVAVVAAFRWPLLPLFLLPLVAVHDNAARTAERNRAALHDPLTGLANRALLLRRTREALEEADAAGHSAALFLLDLDRFRAVNDTLGHGAGDQILQLTAYRLEAALRPGDVVARLGGDEFAVLLPVVRDEEAAREIAERIRAALERTCVVHDTHIDLDASVGIAMYPAHGISFDELLQRADIAMYAAKTEQTAIEAYSADRDPNSQHRLVLLGTLRRAVEDGELEVHYQPKVRVEDGAVAGVEALVRWRHPTRGLVMPDEFVPLAEQTGLMKRLTDHVLDIALRQVAEWHRGGMNVPVAVNVSMRDLQDDDFATRLGERLRRHGVPPSLLILEITERVLMADAARTAATLSQLDAVGVRISLDDFGTGYSSLVMLKRLPVKEIKVDRSFTGLLGQVSEDEDDAAIVRSIIDLGHSLGLTVVAEGVESRAALDRLRSFGCDRAQGWHLSPALPAAEMTAWLRRRAPEPGLRAVEGLTVAG